MYSVTHSLRQFVVEGNAGSREDLLLTIGLLPQISLSNPGAKTRQGMIGQYTCRSTIPEVKERTWLLLSVGTIESFEACEPSQETKAGVVGLSIAARP